MFKWQDVPIENLADVIAYHRHRLELAQSRFASRTTDPRYQGFPRQIKRMQQNDQRQIDHYQKVVVILEAVQSRMVVLDGLKQD